VSQRAIIAVAPNGARLGKADHPALPLSPLEIVRCCESCVDEGATMLHLHVRDTGGRHILSAEAARDLAAQIKARVGDKAVIQTTTEAVERYAASEQMDFLKAARPEAASLAWREITRPDLSDRQRAYLLDWCRTERIALQYILYDASDVQSLQDAIAKGIVPEERPHVLYVVGRYQTAAPVDGRAVADFLATGFAPRSFMVCAFGTAGYQALTAAALLGGHVRTGFENSLVLANGEIALDNAAMVASIRDRLTSLGIGVAGAEEARSVLTGGS
jgi:3-keto-5-aminohexanoate cleavage enzyme